MRVKGGQAGNREHERRRRRMRNMANGCDNLVVFSRIHFRGRRAEVPPKGMDALHGFARLLAGRGHKARSTFEKRGSRMGRTGFLRTCHGVGAHKSNRLGQMTGGYLNG